MKIHLKKFWNNNTNNDQMKNFTTDKDQMKNFTTENVNSKNSNHRAVHSVRTIVPERKTGSISHP